MVVVFFALAQAVNCAVYKQLVGQVFHKCFIDPRITILDFVGDDPEREVVEFVKVKFKKFLEAGHGDEYINDDIGFEMLENWAECFCRFDHVGR